MDDLVKHINDLGEFLCKYSTHLMGSGVHTSRVVRCTKRIGRAYGYKVRLNLFQKTMVIYLENKDKHEVYNRVVDLPSLPISFEHNAELSALSWRVHDDKIPLEEAEQSFDKISKTYSVKPWMILILASLANAAFCAIFGGDWIARGIVFGATVIGFYLKQRLLGIGLNHYIVFIVSAFVASMCASSSMFLETTRDIAIGTSVLFLVPGVPLINGVLDVLEGYSLTGMSRLIQATLLIVCIAIGLSFTLIFVKQGLL